MSSWSGKRWLAWLAVTLPPLRDHGVDAPERATLKSLSVNAVPDTPTIAATTISRHRTMTRVAPKHGRIQYWRLQRAFRSSCCRILCDERRLLRLDSKFRYGSRDKIVIRMRVEGSLFGQRSSPGLNCFI